MPDTSPSARIYEPNAKAIALLTDKSKILFTENGKKLTLFLPAIDKDLPGLISGLKAMGLSVQPNVDPDFFIVEDPEREVQRYINAVGKNQDAEMSVSVPQNRPMSNGDRPLSVDPLSFFNHQEIDGMTRLLNEDAQAMAPVETSKKPALLPHKNRLKESQLVQKFFQKQLLSEHPHTYGYRGTVLTSGDGEQFLVELKTSMEKLGFKPPTVLLGEDPNQLIVELDREDHLRRDLLPTLLAEREKRGKNKTEESFAAREESKANTANGWEMQ